MRTQATRQYPGATAVVCLLGLAALTACHPTGTAKIGGDTSTTASSPSTGAPTGSTLSGSQGTGSSTGTGTGTSTGQGTGAGTGTSTGTGTGTGTSTPGPGPCPPGATGSVSSQFDGIHVQIPQGADYTPGGLLTWGTGPGDGLICDWHCTGIPAASIRFVAGSCLGDPDLSWPISLGPSETVQLCFYVDTVSLGDTGSCDVVTSSGVLSASWEAVP